MRRGFELGFTVLAAVLTCYGIFCASAGSGTHFFIVWFLLALISLGISGIIRFGLWTHFPKPLRVFLVFMVTLATAWVSLCGILISGSFGSRGEPGLEYVIVLGAQVHRVGPSVVLKYRLDTAVEYLLENPETKCIVSGGKGANEPFSEAEGMSAYLESRGISSERIILEDQSTNTVENIENSLSLISGGSRVGIVTNNFHVYRSLAIAKKQGLENAVGIAAPSNPLNLPHNVLRESVGIAKDLLLGNM